MIQKYANTLPREHRSTPWYEHMSAEEALLGRSIAIMEFVGVLAVVAAAVVVWLVL